MNRQSLTPTCTADILYGHTNITQEHGGKYLQDADVLESGEVALGDACEVIPIQLPAKTDTQTCINYSSICSLRTCCSKDLNKRG